MLLYVPHLSSCLRNTSPPECVGIRRVMRADLYTSHDKSINPIVAKCENVLIQSPWIGMTWNQSFQSYYYTYESSQSSQKNDSDVSIKSINQLNMCIHFLENLFCWRFFGKRAISLTFLGFFESIQLIQSYQCLTIDSVTYFMKTNWLGHQATHLEKELNQFDQFSEKMNRFKSINWVELTGI